NQPTCPGDGWLTLGAGNYARLSAATVDTFCPLLSVHIETPDGIGAFLPDEKVFVHDNQNLPWGTSPGALAESMRCTTAVGPGAAIAAARPYGRVDHYFATLPENVEDALGACVLSIVDLGTVAGPTNGYLRRAQARAADAALAKV